MARSPSTVDIPSLPKWAEEAARTAPNPEQWTEAVRGVGRLAQKRVVAALEDWEKQTKARLGRLEAYSVDSRLERDKIEDVLHAARTGDVSQGLATYQQVDRVVALKERHLDQAREELERVVALLKDMKALGFPPPQDPTQISEELEHELRAGRLAALKQQIRALRLQSVNRLKIGLPAYITECGDSLIRERANGTAVELEAMELARGARDFYQAAGRSTAPAPRAGAEPSSGFVSTRPDGTRSAQRSFSKNLTSSLKRCRWRTPASWNSKCVRSASAAVNRASTSTHTSCELLCRAQSRAVRTSAEATPCRRPRDRRPSESVGNSRPRSHNPRFR